MNRDTCVQRVSFARTGRDDVEMGLQWRSVLDSIPVLEDTPSDLFEDISEDGSVDGEEPPDKRSVGAADKHSASDPESRSEPPAVTAAGQQAVRPDQLYSWNSVDDSWCDEAGQPVSPADFFHGSSVLALLGIYGCRLIEDFVLAGLALGEPVLLIGAPGGAKTAMTERLAADMGLRFWAYDASKAMFEDIVGFPDPSSLANGEVRYVPTPLSLQGKEFVLVDEVSRAHPALQNKWLEIIRSRRVMGIELPELQIVFGAMNPAGLSGTVPLDEALAGRFTFHLHMPDINTMSDEDRCQVIEAADRSPVNQQDPSSRLRWVVRAVRTAMPVVESAHGVAITRFVTELSRYLAGRDWQMDGRRQGMIRRGLVAYAAVRSVFDGGGCDTARLGKILHRGVDALLPFDAMGRELPRIILDGAKQYAMSAMGGNVRPLPPSDLLVAAEMVARGRATADSDQMSLMVTRILSTMDRGGKPEEQIRAAAALLTLALSPGAMGVLPVESRQRVMVAFSDSLEVNSSNVGDYLDESFKTSIEGLDPKVHEPVMRVAFNMRSRRARHRGMSMDYEQMVETLSRFMIEGGAAC